MFKHKDATNHGIDIAKGRVDEFDKKILQFAMQYKGKKVAIDIGAGESRASVILALLGFEIWLYDISDCSKYCATLKEGLGLGGRVHCIQKDIRLLTPEDIPDDIVIAVSQRTLHHIEYTYAQKLLKIISQKIIIDGKLFISVSSPESKFVDTYDCVNSSIENRFCKVLSSDDFYNIEGSVCLYKEKEVVDILKSADFAVKKVYKSVFGNIKAISKKQLKT